MSQADPPPVSKKQSKKISKKQKPQKPKTPKLIKIVIRKLPSTNYYLDDFVRNLSQACEFLGITSTNFEILNFMAGKLSRRRGPIPGAGFVSFIDEATASVFLNGCPHKVAFLEGDLFSQPDIERSLYQNISTKTKPDKLADTIYEEPDYIAFCEKISKPVEKLPSAEVQLEQKEKTGNKVQINPKDAPLLRYLRAVAEKKLADRKAKDRAKQFEKRSSANKDSKSSKDSKGAHPVSSSVKAPAILLKKSLDKIGGGREEHSAGHPVSKDKGASATATATSGSNPSRKGGKDKAHSREVKAPASSATAAGPSSSHQHAMGNNGETVGGAHPGESTGPVEGKKSRKERDRERAKEKAKQKNSHLDEHKMSSEHDNSGVGEVTSSLGELTLASPSPPGTASSVEGQKEKREKTHREPKQRRPENPSKGPPPHGAEAALPPPPQPTFRIMKREAPVVDQNNHSQAALDKKVPHSAHAGGTASATGGGSNGSGSNPGTAMLKRLIMDGASGSGAGQKHRQHPPAEGQGSLSDHLAGSDDPQDDHYGGRGEKHGRGRRSRHGGRGGGRGRQQDNHDHVGGEQHSPAPHTQG